MLLTSARCTPGKVYWLAFRDLQTQYSVTFVRCNNFVNWTE